MHYILRDSIQEDESQDTGQELTGCSNGWCYGYCKQRLTGYTCGWLRRRIWMCI
jgi:hypothetical protein